MTSGLATDPRVHVLRFDTERGTLTRSEAVSSTIDVSRVDVPGLGLVLIEPHGTVFSNPRR